MDRAAGERRPLEGTRRWWWVALVLTFGVATCSDVPTEQAAPEPTGEPAVVLGPPAGEVDAGGGTVAVDVDVASPGPDPTAPPYPDHDTVAPPPPDEPDPRSFTVAATGDLLIHSPVWGSAAGFAAGSGEDGYDFRPMFEQVAPVLEAADLSVCHLEVPLSPDSQALSGFPLFNAPWQLAPAVADAGYDTCSTASNHSVDQGSQGVTATLDILDDAGLAHAGTARSAEEAETPRLHDADGVTVGHVAATYGLNGLPLPQPWMVDMLDVEAIAANADQARAAGAEFVIASLHWGVEYRREPTDEQRRVAEELLSQEAVDLIVGHHAHVVQPIERVDDRVVVYGLGNFLSNQSAACCVPATQDGIIGLIEVAEVAPDEFAVDEVHAVPTWVDRNDGHRIVDVLTALEHEPEGWRREQLQASLQRTREALDPGDGNDPSSLVSAEDAADR